MSLVHLLPCPHVSSTSTRPNPTQPNPPAAAVAVAVFLHATQQSPFPLPPPARQRSSAVSHLQIRPRPNPRKDPTFALSHLCLQICRARGQGHGRPAGDRVSQKASKLKKMAILCASHIGISPANSRFPSGWLSQNDSPRVCYHIPITRRKLIKQSRHQRVISFSKSSSLQDPVASVKPSRLLQTDELRIFRNNVPEEIISTIRLEESDAYYMLELSTSREFSSSLLDKNAAILICLINSDGDSLLQRVPAVYWDDSSQGRKAEQMLPFQSGSVDVVTFKGYKLQRIKEVWIGLESGSWRINNLSLKVIHGPLYTPPDLEVTPEHKFNGLQYTFDQISMLVGEDGASVVEARPVAVTDLLGISLSDLQEGQLSSASATSSILEMKEDGLKEYADLKQSLLLYDLAIVITGFSAFTLASNDSAAYSFLVGGIGGFLYLLLLQKSVDGLPVLNSPSEAGNAQPSVKGFSGIRRPWLILSLLMVAGAVALKYGAGGDKLELTPVELFVGTAGFLANKVAVLLAAFKPLQTNLKTEDQSGNSA
uniref:DUF7755 domain-containing protein n=1 Tax=Leersia perrieri TaxID=77586 RepID=A0A0D9XS71_9ORYZ